MTGSQLRRLGPRGLAALCGDVATAQVLQANESEHTRSYLYTTIYLYMYILCIYIYDIICRFFLVVTSQGHFLSLKKRSRPIVSILARGGLKSILLPSMYTHKETSARFSSY